MTEYRCTWWEKTDKPLVWDGPVGRQVFRNLETGEERAWHELPIGALFDGDGRKGMDGHAVNCVIPSTRYKSGRTPWCIDARATNCTRPDDNTHRCWVRHGTIGELIHVDKDGDTCAAGAGSIAVTGFHGFLHHGILRDC